MRPESEKELVQGHCLANQGRARTQPWFSNGPSSVFCTIPPLLPAAILVRIKPSSTGRKQLSWNRKVGKALTGDQSSSPEEILPASSSHPEPFPCPAWQQRAPQRSLILVTSLWGARLSAKTFHALSHITLSPTPEVGSSINPMVQVRNPGGSQDYASLACHHWDWKPSSCPQPSGLQPRLH